MWSFRLCFNAIHADWEGKEDGQRQQQQFVNGAREGCIRNELHSQKNTSVRINTLWSPLNHSLDSSRPVLCFVWGKPLLSKEFTKDCVGWRHFIRRIWLFIYRLCHVRYQIIACVVKELFFITGLKRSKVKLLF